MTQKTTTKKQVKPTEEQDPRWIFSSMKHLTQVMGIPMPILQWAKAEGCQAFQPGQARIYLDKLLPWIMTRMTRSESGEADETKDEIEKRLAKAKADNEELKFLEDSKQLVRLSTAIQMICEPIDIIRQEMQIMPATQAPLCNPSDPIFAREALEEWRRQAMKSMNDKLTTLDPMTFSEEK